MNEPRIDDTASGAPADLSRRSLLGGLTLAAGAIGLGVTSGLPGGAVHAAADPGSQIEALSATIPGLAYVSLDALAFDTAQLVSTPYRLYQESPATGMQPSTAPAYLYAALPIPIGAVVKQINICVVGQPFVSIARRSFTDGSFTPVTDLLSPSTGSGIVTQSFATDVELTHGGSYAMRVFCSAGQSVLGMTVGYVPAAQAFIPYTGSQPRVLDTRDPGGTKFAANEERVIDLSSRLIPTARAAVINLTATETNGGGFLSAYADGISWPNNSTVNYSAAGQTVANAAVVTMASGRIKVRAGVNGAHVIVDVVGSLL